MITGEVWLIADKKKKKPDLPIKHAQMVRLLNNEFEQGGEPVRVKLKEAGEAVQNIKNGSTVMIGGFDLCGHPETLISALLNTGARDLTVITNNSGLPGRGVDLLYANHRAKKAISTHIALNHIVEQLFNAGEMELLLVPQGTFCERIRAGGAGLGGVLTPTGIDTLIAAGKEVIEIEGRPYVLELPLRADYALIRAYKADLAGNLCYRYTARNFNPIMATAAEIVIAEVEQLVDNLEPEKIITPGLFVDILVLAAGEKYAKADRGLY